MLTEQQRRKLQKIATSRKNVIISGATGSGKTTLLAAMICEVPANERIIGIEEAPELSSSIHPGLVLMSARQPNSEGTGEVKLAQLMKATLRMRPDRIVLGECRGDEVREFLLALGAGYSGSITTLHADCASSVRNRVETLAYMAGVYTKLAENQFDQYVDVVIHLQRTSSGRKVQEILNVGEPKSPACALATEIGVLKSDVQGGVNEF
jgi:pilus assembly protein CpaF